jgi:hypothetical protein
MGRVIRRKSGPVRPVGARNATRGVRATPVTPPSPQKAPEPSLAPKKVCIGCGIRLATHEFRIKDTGTWNPVCRLCMSIGLANPGTDAHGNPREYDWRCIRPGKRKAPDNDLYDFIRKSMVESVQVAEDKAIIFGTGNVGASIQTHDDMYRRNYAGILAEERVAMQVHKPKSFVNITVTP